MPPGTAWTSRCKSSWLSVQQSVRADLSRAFPSHYYDYPYEFNWHGSTTTTVDGRPTCTASFLNMGNEAFSSHPPYTGHKLPHPTVAANDSLGLHHTPIWVTKTPQPSDLHYYMTAFPGASLLRSCHPYFGLATPPVALPPLPDVWVSSIAGPSVGPVATPVPGASVTDATTTPAPEVTASPSRYGDDPTGSPSRASATSAQDTNPDGPNNADSTTAVPEVTGSPSQYGDVPTENPSHTSATSGEDAEPDGFNNANPATSSSTTGPTPTIVAPPAPSTYNGGSAISSTALSSVQSVSSSQEFRPPVAVHPATLAPASTTANAASTNVASGLLPLLFSAIKGSAETTRVAGEATPASFSGFAASGAEPTIPLLGDQAPPETSAQAENGVASAIPYQGSAYTVVPVESSNPSSETSPVESSSSGVPLHLGSPTTVADSSTTNVVLLSTNSEGRTELVLGSSTTTLSSMEYAAQPVSTYTLAGQTVVASAGAVFLQVSSEIEAPSATVSGQAAQEPSATISGQSLQVMASANTAGDTLLAVGTSTLTIAAAGAVPASTFTFGGQAFVQSAGNLFWHASVSNTPTTSTAGATSPTDSSATPSGSGNIAGNIAGYIMSGLAAGSSVSGASNASSTQGSPGASANATYRGDGYRHPVSWSLGVLLVFAGVWISLVA